MRWALSSMLGGDYIAVEGGPTTNAIFLVTRGLAPEE